MKKKPNIPAAGRVKDPDDYYRKELKTYSDWRQAWPREVGQNSIDAGATEILITVKASPDRVKDAYGRETDSCIITWADNGSGLYREKENGDIVLISGFLTLGGSDKDGSGVGGFGWAKKLIAFAMCSYEIHTGYIRLKGKGAEYTTEIVDEFIDGTIFIVHAPCGQFDMLTAIKKWASWTDVDCKLMLNGRKLPTFKDTYKVKGKNTTQFDWADIVTLEDTGTLITVRIGGQMMYQWWGPSDMPHNVVVDITGKDSTKYFTTNRDGLTHQYKADVNQWLKKLHKDPRSIEVRPDPTIENYGGQKGFIILEGMSDEERSKRIAEELKRLADNPDLLAEMLKKKRAKQDRFGKPVYEGFNMVVSNQTGKEIPKRFIPGEMSGPAAHWMTVWTGMILLVGDITKYNGEITPGWTFKPGVLATWQDCRGGGRMLLNPVDIDVKTGKFTNRLDKSRPCFNRVLMTCIHEYTHAFGYNWHDESFISQLETLTGKVMNAWDRVDALWAATRKA